jgi:hypothetical protein
MSWSNETAVSAATGADISRAQQDLAAAVRGFVECAAAQEETGGGKLAAFAPDAVTATEAMIAVSAILKAVNVQVFELGMWQSFNGK